MKTTTITIAIIFAWVMTGCSLLENRQKKLFAEKFEFYANLLTDASRSVTGVTLASPQSKFVF